MAKWLFSTHLCSVSGSLWLEFFGKKLCFRVGRKFGSLGLERVYAFGVYWARCT